jgi:hypothetical protein
MLLSDPLLAPLLAIAAQVAIAVVAIIVIFLIR